LGGWIDAIITWLVDVGMTIPGILILILIAIAVKGINPLQMALVVASVAWLHPTRGYPDHKSSLSRSGPMWRWRKCLV
jgi:ABC-type dipeptide/oligopeptide/nickel transport system permease subunit